MNIETEVLYDAQGRPALIRAYTPTKESRARVIEQGTNDEATIALALRICRDDVSE
jgi:hypothetical protein